MVSGVGEGRSGAGIYSPKKVPAERMETTTLNALRKAGQVNGTDSNHSSGTEVVSKTQKSGKSVAPDPLSTSSLHVNSANGLTSVAPMAFMYLHQGRVLEADMTVEDSGIDDADEIHAVELMDLTGPMPDDAVSSFRHV